MSRRLLPALLVVVSAAASASFLLSSGAGAEAVATSRRATAANWYWRAQAVSPVDGSPVLSDPRADGSTLVVSGPTVDGQADRFAVLALDLTGLPSPDALRRTLLVLPLSGSTGAPTGTPADATVEDAPVAVLPSLVVCATRGGWQDGPGGRPFAEAPTVDCGTRTRALPGADSRYRVDVSELVPLLVRGEATGLALVPDLDQPAPYELRFGPRADVVLDVLYDRAAPPPAGTGTTTTTAPEPEAPADPGAGAGGTGVPSALPAPVTEATVSTPPAAPVEVVPVGTLGPEPFEFERAVARRAPLAVFALFAVIGALGLLVLSPSLT